MQAKIEEFIAEMRSSLGNSTFVKLTLSHYIGTEPHLQKVSARPVELKKGRRLMFQYRYDTRDAVKNFEFDNAAREVSRLLGAGFRSGHMFTTASDLQLTIGKKNARLTTGKPSLKAAVDSTHNREKKTLIDSNAFYLKALGIATDDEKIRADARDKWKQINKFVEILAGLIESSTLKDKKDLRIVDMGSGKGYLTFALYDYLANSSPPYKSGVPAGASPSGVDVVGVAEALRGRGGSQLENQAEPAIQITGIEQRPELVSFCNDLARSGGFDGLNFIEGTIADTELDNVNILIALHACDTATDDALYKGIKANAAIIVAAPCCHKEIKKQMKPPDLLSGILKHPVMLERTAETITDGIRSMLLESRGYKTKMFEFVATEHTPKNNLLVATRKGDRVDTGKSDEQIQAVKELFGIHEQRLDALLSDV